LDNFVCFLHLQISVGPDYCWLVHKPAIVRCTHSNFGLLLCLSSVAAIDTPLVGRKSCILSRFPQLRPWFRL